MGRKTETERLVSPERRHLGKMIKVLAERTNASGLRAQAAALGTPKSTLQRWISGEAMPSESGFDDMLLAAGLSHPEQQTYREAWKAARGNPPVPLPAPADS
ncbi:hypothetical protein, partial [Actinomadura rubrisoli]